MFFEEDTALLEQFYKKGPLVGGPSYDSFHLLISRCSG